jgi:hypothetical protein
MRATSIEMFGRYTQPSTQASVIWYGRYGLHLSEAHRNWPLGSDFHRDLHHITASICTSLSTYYISQPAIYPAASYQTGSYTHRSEPPQIICTHGFDRHHSLYESTLQSCGVSHREGRL